jgi:hypothetical protein
VTQRGEEAVVPLDGDEAAEAAPCDVLEKHALDRIARAELAHLRITRFDDSHA